MSAVLELGIVIPVFNEENHILSLITDWSNVFTNQKINHQFFMVNDGSTDGSLKLLEALKDSSIPMEIISQTNQGHGPAIWKGLNKALTADWVFQIDADHQFDVSAFTDMWGQRKSYDFLIAERTEKNASRMRNILSNSSSLLVQQLFGKGVQDVNSPYRLIRGSVLAMAISQIPKKSFAPNILLTAYFVFKQSRIYLTSVNLSKSAIIRKSRMNAYLLIGSLRSLIQTISFRFRL